MLSKNSASDEIATKTLAELGKENEEFKKTNLREPMEESSMCL